jgi:protease IV
VDRLEYEDEFDDRVEKHGGAEHQTIDYSTYARPSIYSAFSHQDRIAVIYGQGAIERSDDDVNPFSPGGASMTADSVGKAFEEARDDSSVRAVLFRINSPGGSVIASELIRRQVELTAKKKPVVVSMSGYGASGGYWVSTPAAKIFADPGTITGSIGVLGGKFNVSPAAAKLYTNTGAVTRGANFEMFDMWTDFTPAQAKQFQDRMLGDTYNYFLKIVAAGRHMNIDQVNTIAQGRVWTGEQASRLKLIDSEGGFCDAFAAAKTMAHLAPGQPISIEELPELPGLLQMLLNRQLAGAESGSIFEPISRIIRAALGNRGLLSTAYCPVVPTI